MKQNKPPAILITQCLQNDFVKPLRKFDPLPNQLHIGYEESKRLVGEDPEYGPVNTLMNWAYRQSRDHLGIIHIRDWHNPEDEVQKNHLKQFGAHCIENTKGAEFIFQAEHANENPHEYDIVNATGLNDCVETNLLQVLEKFSPATQKIKIGLIGVWTEAKITYLAYDLITRFNHIELAVCSALTASASRTMHFIALDQMTQNLGVKVCHSLSSFTGFLTGTEIMSEQRLHRRVGSADFHFEGDRVSPEDENLLRYLFRETREVSFNILDGGFSGNVVMKAGAVDMHGHRQVPVVIKIGEREAIASERIAFEKVEEVLGNNAPSIVDYIEYKNRAAIKYRYAAMLDEQVKTFQKLVEKEPHSSENTEKILRVLNIVFKHQLGRFYQARRLEKMNLLEYYEFSSKYADGVESRVKTIPGVQQKKTGIYLDGEHLPDVVHFYRETLNQYSETPTGHYTAFVHGDLNGANIIIDGQNNVWLIDFFHTHQGHILKDLIKLENDTLFIFSKIENEDEYNEMKLLVNSLLLVTDLGVEIELPEFKNNQVARVAQVIKKLRSFYRELVNTDRSPYQYHVAMLRYTMHTLSFEEANDYQKKLALYMGAHLSEKIIQALKLSKSLRIDWLPSTKLAGKIGLTILPGRRDRDRSLAEDIEVMKSEKIKAVLVLITLDEFEEYGVSELIGEYKNSGFEVLHKPVADQSVPSQRQRDDILQWLEQKTSQGQHVLVHCVGGLGRSGTIAAMYLMKMNHLNAREAIRAVRAARSERAIESNSQLRSIREFEQHLSR